MVEWSWKDFFYKNPFQLGLSSLINSANFIQNLFLKSTPVPPLSFLPSLCQHIKPCNAKKKNNPFCFNERAHFGVACSHQETIIPVAVRGQLCHPNRDWKFEFVIVSYQERKVGTCNTEDSAG